jgi:hypothetical protein
MKPARIITRIIPIWCVAVLAYGLWMYPDAPFKACVDGPYCGKRHTIHSESDYQGFIRWQATLFISWPFGMVAVYLIRREKQQPGK